ncbi:FxSxx-COOH cyclophane-containing RiPP peptide [Streptomyces sp. 900105755]|uniref:FxSxx-COOH cyclophane-containing RiPP peptide n=1 Tax=Streptomyces sp. NPDC001507 TaxID=3364579 RepID=UPI00369DEC73
MERTFGSEYSSGLVDLTGVSMGDLDDMPDTAFTAALRRVIDEVLHPTNEPMAGFQSAL